MSRPNLKIAGEPPVRTAEREALAAAIERHTAALDAVKRVSQAREQADETVYRAHDALRAAESALTEAQAGEGARLAALAMGEDGGISAAGAEATVTQAANDLSIARRTRDALDERGKHEAKEVEHAREALERCVGAVVKTEVSVTKLLAEAKAVQADLIARRIQLRYLYNGFLEERESELRSFLLFQNYLPAARGQLEHGSFNAHPADAAWKAAIEALRHDADASLPG